MDFNSSNSISDCNDHFANNLLFNTAIISVFLCVGIIGNGQVLYLYRFKMPQTEERFFIPHLAVADLMSCVSLACLGITINYFYVDFYNEVLCQLLHYFSWVTSSWSAFILLLISISRYLKICRPTGRQMTVFRKKCAVFGCLLFAIINTSPVIYFAGYRYQNVSCLKRNITVVMCELRDFSGTTHILKMVYIFFEICVIFLNAGITAALYVPIGYQIYTRFRKKPQNANQPRDGFKTKPSFSVDESETVNSEPLTVSTKFSEEELDFRDEGELDSVKNPENESQKDGGNLDSNYQDIKPSSQSKRSKKCTSLSRYENNIKVRNNFTYMFITIIIFYLLSYLPTFIVILLATGDPFHYWYSMDFVTLNVIMLLRRSSIINHIVNPFIYGYFDRVYRKFFKICFVCKKS